MHGCVAAPGRPLIAWRPGAAGILANTATMAGAILMALLLLAGCSSIGPGTVTRDRFDYTAAVAESWKSQMLLNLVKLRYGDTPVFLDVGQIISGYTLEGTLSAGGTIFNTPGGVPGVPDSSVILGAQGRYTDRPTITYAPLVGERFARAMMTPLPPPAILSLIQSGYPVDAVLRLAVHEVNGLRNRYGGDFRARPADPEFYALLRDLRRIQAAGGIGIRVQRTDRGEAILMTLRQKVDAATTEAILAVRQLLGLDPTAQDIRVVYGSVAANDKELAILSRSILEILIDLSSFISVPEAHVLERRVGPTHEDEGGAEGPIRPLIRIGSATERPNDVFAAVRYRGHWFTIDDHDMPSKRLFSFLMFLFTLVETGGKEGAPVVTIPAQ
jgi:hypothetical protein